MALTASLIHQLTTSPAGEAWQAIIDQALDIASAPLEVNKATSVVTKRDREIGNLDNFLASSGWDLWEDFTDAVERTSDRLIRWWNEPYSQKAILILDGLSLRELPWLLQGAEQHGFTIHQATATASEIPGETNEFAQALGFSSRSQLQNNGGGVSHKLQPARTECVDMPWQDCTNLIDASPNWIFWHHWPDSKVHDAAGAGQGLDVLVRDAAEQLTSNEFWAFVKRLANGRHLIITSDHGYAATGYFPDADGEVAQFLKQTFSSGRSKPESGDTGPFVPPVVLQLDTPHGTYRLAVGRRKWKSQGGYPTLTHGGLSLLEVLSPFVELTITQ